MSPSSADTEDLLHFVASVSLPAETVRRVDARTLQAADFGAQ